jgi:hypothetical protein
MVEDNNLLSLIERVSINCFIDKYFHLIRHKDFSWLKELENINVAQATLSLKEKAVLYDILGMGNKKEEYHVIALEAYALYIKNSVNITSNNTLNDLDLVDNIMASFIRSYIYRDIDKKKTWYQIINTLHGFIQNQRDNQDIFLNDITICFLLLVKENDKFRDVLSIYYDLLVKADDYRLLEWVFNKNIYNPLFNTVDLFNTYENKNNISNITSAAQERIKKSGKLDLLKTLARHSFQNQYDNIYITNNGFCANIDGWISNILTDNDKNILKNYYKSMLPSYFATEQLSIYWDKTSKNTLEQIKRANSLEEAIQLIISVNTDEFIAENMNIWENLTGPGRLIIEPIKSLTGEVKYNDAENIRYQKLNVLYHEMFNALPKWIPFQEEVANLIKKWTIVNVQFHQNMKWYLASILYSDTPEWQKKANINQLSLLIEQILLSLNPSEYKKIVNKKGVTELNGEEFENLVKKLTKVHSYGQDFLLGAFREHRNKIAHGRTFDNFGNCYFILQGIIKIFYMKHSDFNLSNG